MATRVDHDARESSIRQLIIAGKSNEEIAAVVRLDVRTVESYIRRYGLSRLRRRLGLKPRVSRRQPVARIGNRACLGCGVLLPAEHGRWLCNPCRARRTSDSRGVPDHWLEMPGLA